MPLWTAEEDAILVAGSNASQSLETLLLDLPRRSAGAISNRRMHLRDSGRAVIAAKQGRPPGLTAEIDREEASFRAQTRVASAALRDAILAMRGRSYG